MKGENRIAKFNELQELMRNTSGELLISEYIDYKTPVTFKCGYCSCTGSLKYHDLKASKGFCPNCRYERSSDKLKTQEDKIRKELESVGVSLLSPYINTKTKLILKCKCGETFERVYSKFETNGYYCKDCKSDLQKEIKIKEYINYIESNGHIVKNVGVYKGSQTLFEVLCSCGEGFTKVIREYKKRPACKTCLMESWKAKINFNNEEVSDIISSKSDCTLLSKDYKNRNSLLILRCGCGETFETYLDRFLHENKRQCNPCGISKRSGSNNHKWKGGVTSKNAKSRQSKEYVLWRDSVYQRDDYTCKCCEDSSGGNIQAHHIENFSENYDLRLSIHNGITMCSTCHDFRNKGSFHHLYGTRDNSFHQLQDYFNEKREELGLPPINIEDIIYKDYIFVIDKNS